MTIFKKSDVKKEKLRKKRWKIACFSNVRFGRHFGTVLGGFWKASVNDFRNFSIKNVSQKWNEFWMAKKSHFGASKANCGRSAAVCAGPGEGIKGWGKALGVGILGCAFEAGFRGRQFLAGSGSLSGTLGSPFGRRRMCCARTTALQGKNEKPQEMQARVSCSN